MEITSVNNELVKDTVKLQQKKYRTQSGKFLLEGFKAIREAFDSGIIIEKIFVDKSKKDEYKFAKDLIIETNETVLKKIGTTDSAPESVAIGLQKIYDKNILKASKKVVLLEDIKDLGNLGTIIRSSVAFGADAIVLYGESVDIYNPKCVRASVGNLWKLPIIEIKDFQELSMIFANFERIATLPRTNNMLKTFEAKFPTVVMFGSEANGLSQELIKFSTTSVKIEMAQTVESLNLATSVSVILYKLFI
ncbi:MAG: RNA methyltransferase [Cyanobacteria bacterium SIG26]|nr:RNA methyltransferase [Cyanobacteria bacterium SIG26]